MDLVGVFCLWFEFSLFYFGFVLGLFFFNYYYFNKVAEFIWANLKKKDIISLAAFPILVHCRTTQFYTSTAELQVSLWVGSHRKRLGMLQLATKGGGFFLFVVCLSP